MTARAVTEAATMGTRLGHLRIQQLCPSIGEACGVGNFASNLETAIRAIGVDLRSTSSLIDTRIGDLLVQHEFGLFDTWVLKQALKLHVGRRVLFAHSPGAEVFSKDVDAFVSLCEGTVRTDIPHIVLPHPGWQSPLRNRHDLKCQFGWSEYSAVVGTNGFMNSTRQFVEIVSRLIEFAVEHNVLIFVACPRHFTHHDNSEYVRHERLLLSIAESYPRNLRLEQAFLDQNALNLRLQACDLLWCWTGSPSAAYGSGTCSDQYASGTRLVVTKKQQHSQVFGLPGAVLGATDIDSFVSTLKNEVLNANFDRHDPSPLSWESFSMALRNFILSVPRDNSSNRSYAIDVPKSCLVDNEGSPNATGQFRVPKKTLP